MNLRRPLGLVTSLGLVVTMSSMTSASAAVPTTAEAAQQPVVTGSSFYTSFEPGQPQPGYTDAVETGPDGVTCCVGYAVVRTGEARPD